MRRLYCLLGDPVAHSLSPRLHARAFELLGVDAVYAPLRVAAAELAAAVAGLRALEVAGFNVTVPHKEAVFRLVDRAEPSATASGAVNCVARVGGALVGHNTDGDGLLRALRVAGVDPAGARAVVIGAGGSARAAAVALAPRAASLSIANRTAARAEALEADLIRHGSRSGAAPLRALGLDAPDFAPVLAEATLVVHCTSAGMGGGPLALDPALLPRGATLVDLVYAGEPGARPGQTALVQAAAARGLRTVDGLEVLIHQAIASLEIWLSQGPLDRLAAQLRAAAEAA